MQVGKLGKNTMTNFQNLTKETNEQKSKKLVEELKERRGEFLYKGVAVRHMKFTNAKEKTLHSLTVELTGTLKPIVGKIFDIYAGKTLEEHIAIWKQSNYSITVIK